MFVLLFVLWLILCGRFSADAGMLQICLVGAAVAGLICLFARHALQYTLRTELRLWKNLPLLIAYGGLLIKEIVVANGQMLRLVLRKNIHLDPVIVQFHVPLHSRFARVVLANSITLTPGTITAEMEGDLLTVHCIDRSFSAGLKDSPFIKLLKRLEQSL